MTSELNQVLEQHRLWLNGKGGKCANLEGANLKDANLTDAKLTGAYLNGADLYCANLRGASLNDANLSYADLAGANLTGADLNGANLSYADLRRADLRRADLRGAFLGAASITGAILPDISWIIPGCLVQLNNFKYGFYLEKEDKLVNFVQDSFGFIIQNNVEEDTFDMLLGDRIIRGIPDWVKYTVLKKVATV